MKKEDNGEEELAVRINDLKEYLVNMDEEFEFDEERLWKIDDIIRSFCKGPADYRLFTVVLEWYLHSFERSFMDTMKQIEEELGVVFVLKILNSIDLDDTIEDSINKEFRLTLEWFKEVDLLIKKQTDLNESTKIRRNVAESLEKLGYRMKKVNNTRLGVLEDGIKYNQWYEHHERFLDELEEHEKEYLINFTVYLLSKTYMFSNAFSFLEKLLSKGEKSSFSDWIEGIIHLVCYDPIEKENKDRIVSLIQDMGHEINC